MDAGTLVSTRFRIVRCIGSGATGDVYEAVDRERGGRTAIKALRLQHPLAISRFKHEFRVLQDLEHPNLVSLGELIEENGRLFFTMELIDGSDFLSYVRPTGTSFDEPRLRHAFAELGQALEALHARGLVHRDIKPSNVLVTKEDRLVMLDFGLAADVEEHRPTWSGPTIVGTPHYMSPEQAAGQPAAPASDWYSAGVILYEALTGKPPHEGPMMKLLADKQSVEPTPPAELDPAIPADLSALCAALLRFHPSKRPTSATGIRQLARAPSKRAEAKRVTGTPSQGPVFVGRTAELSQLRAILETDVLRDGAPAAVLIRGESGVGKTTLARVFLRSLANDAIVVRGRCFERESVSYKAFDGIIEGLARALGRMEPAAAAAMLPLHATALADVFPELKRVKAFADAPVGAAPAQRDLRDRVFGALRELLVRISRRHTLVLAIDDLQWADDDSLALLADIVRPPEAPALLLVATLRPPGAGGRDDIEARIRDACPLLRTLELGPLEPEASRELAERLCALHDIRDAGGARELSEEAAGHPLFLDELVRHRAATGGTRSLRLEDALWERATALDARARGVLEVIALAGEPIHHDTIVRAADLPPEHLVRTLSLLRVANLVRTTGAGAGADDTVEPYHDRVRAAIVGHLDAARRAALHRALAVALEASPRRGHEPLLAFHWEGAGRLDLAARYAAAAADDAVTTLAFDRAARYYQLAIDLGHPERGELLARLGEALTLDGHGAAAADAYLAAADATPAEEVALDRRRLAAEQLLVSGHIDRGIELITELLATLGMDLPATPRRALVSLVLRRGLLRARGLRFQSRTEGEVAASELRRVDLCWSVAGGLAMVDTVRGADFQTRHLLLALRAGEPTRIARALAVEGGFHAVGGRGSRRRAATLFEQARALLARHPSEDVVPLITGSECINAYQAGEWRRSLE
ncbi:MAG: AAA family ATPase, partial [Myxococcales bacterium]|nr:AAA family ATPase [Myxococcales bacterium]